MEKYNCKICGKNIELLKSHLKNTHKIKIEEYYSKFEMEKEIYDKFMNVSKILRQKRSPNSIHFYLNKGMSIEESNEKLKKHNLNNPFRRIGISPRQKQYWTNKGLSEEEAIRKIHVLNSNTLENLTSIYGEEEGRKRHKKYLDGQKRKKNTLLKKIMLETNTTYEESKNILKDRMRSISAKSLSYWLEKGYSEEEARVEMYKIGRKTSPRSVDYWLIKTNNNKTLALSLLRDYQDNNSITKISQRENVSLDDAQEIQNNILNKMLETLYSNGKLVRPESKGDFAQYKQKINRLTEISYRRFKHIIDPLNLRSKDYHIDHRYSIIQGFFEKIEEYIISSPFNLEIKTSKENLSKQGKCDISIEELLEKIKNNYEIRN